MRREISASLSLPVASCHRIRSRTRQSIVSESSLQTPSPPSPDSGTLCHITKKLIFFFDKLFQSRKSPKNRQLLLKISVFGFDMILDLDPITCTVNTETRWHPVQSLNATVIWEHAIEH